MISSELFNILKCFILLSAMRNKYYYSSSLDRDYFTWQIIFFVLIIALIEAEHRLWREEVQLSGRYRKLPADERRVDDWLWIHPGASHRNLMMEVQRLIWTADRTESRLWRSCARYCTKETDRYLVGELRWYHGDRSSLLRHAVRTFLIQNNLMLNDAL